MSPFSRRSTRPIYSVQCYVHSLVRSVIIVWRLDFSECHVLLLFVLCAQACMRCGVALAISCVSAVYIVWVSLPASVQLFRYYHDNTIRNILTRASSNFYVTKCHVIQKFVTFWVHYVTVTWSLHYDADACESVTPININWGFSVTNVRYNLLTECYVTLLLVFLYFMLTF